MEQVLVMVVVDALQSHCRNNCPEPQVKLVLGAFSCTNLMISSVQSDVDHRRWGCIRPRNPYLTIRRFYPQYSQCDDNK